MSTDLAKLYRLRFPEAELARKQAIWAVLCEDFFSRFVRPQDTVVDLACGHGEFINHIRASHKIAIDLNPESARFLGPETRFYARTAGHFAKVVRPKADVVFTSNFLEHLPDKAALDRLLKEVSSALKTGGRFIILGPNLRYLPGQYWDYYDHHLPLTHLSLCEALRLQGYVVDMCIDRFLPYTTKGALPTHPWLVRAYLRLPFAWRIFGRQFLVIARKPEALSEQ